MIPISKPDVDGRELEEVQSAFEDGWIGLGPKVSEFEDRFGSKFGYDDVVATNSGTAALDLALRSVSTEGTEVLVPPLTWISTAHVPRYNDFEVGWVDVSPRTLNMSPESLEERISSETAAVIPVHYSGQPVRIDEIVEIAHDHGAAVIEDCAHAHGATIDGEPVGTFGDVGCFSFQESKTLTTGEGGALVTDDTEVHDFARRLSTVGVDKSNRFERTEEDGSYDWQYDVTHVGYKYFMHDVSAAIGLAQLEKFDELLGRREEIATRYRKVFQKVSWIELLDEREDGDHGRYNFTFKVPASHRNSFIEHLQERGVSATAHYKPLYKHPVFDDHDPDLPNTESVWKQMVTIPMAGTLTEDEVDQVVEAVLGYDETYREVLRA